MAATRNREVAKMAAVEHVSAYSGAASFADSVAALTEGLASVERTFVSLTEDDWRRPTLLLPLDPVEAPWSVAELAAHFVISIGLTIMLTDGAQDGQPGRDRVSFFIFDRKEVAPIVYQYAIDLARGKTSADLLRELHDTFTRTLHALQTLPPDTIGPGYYALMRLDEFAASRIVEAVVHGMDLTDALGQPPLDIPRANAICASILDELLARRTVAGRPSDLVADDLAWIRAASGRTPHPDPRLPLIG
jgi:uncharacterized protein (TIGR03083 family)